ncbi:hypothetical protein SDC9_129580 [bioreactor metagenome]|uniref:Uncharacterized protein n=1 Tax=bioreactor metagenome TaxID=1076179 RepID=A0A645D022_9ZZZZ
MVDYNTSGTGLTKAQEQQMISRAASTYSNKDLPMVQVWTDKGVIFGGKKYEILVRVR